MKYLALSRTASLTGGRRVREILFEERSALPASAACVVASGARETLGALLAAPVSLRLFEPVIPAPHAWRAILRDAAIYRYRGTVADAAIVLRPRDARALARAAFGETASEDPVPDGPLSALESDVLARVSAAVGASLPAICGVREGAGMERVAEAPAFTTFFELLLERPVRAAIGIAVSREPAPEPQGALELEGLGEVELSLDVCLDVGAFAAAQVAALAPGSLLPLGPGGLRGRLRAGGRTLAYGRCGVRRGWYALAIEGKGVAT
jgi:hypothetical protein